MKGHQISAPGYYWRVQEGLAPSVVMVEEVAVTGRLIMVFHGSHSFEDDLSLIEGEFLGPIYPPALME